MTRSHRKYHRRTNDERAAAQPVFRGELTLQQRRLLDTVIAEARQSANKLRIAKDDQRCTYTALLRDGRLTWKIETALRELIASGECR